MKKSKFKEIWRGLKNLYTEMPGWLRFIFKLVVEAVALVLLALVGIALFLDWSSSWAFIKANQLPALMAPILLALILGMAQAQFEFARLHFVEGKRWGLWMFIVISLGLLGGMGRTIGRDYYLPEFFPTNTPTAVFTVTPYPTYTPLPTYTVVPMPIAVGEGAPTSTLEPLTPWLVEHFSGNNLRLSMWIDPACKSSYLNYQQGFGYAAFLLNQTVNECRLEVRPEAIAEYGVSRIVADFELYDVEQETTGWAGIETSCGANTVWFNINRDKVMRQRNSEAGSVQERFHDLKNPRLTLEIEWQGDGNMYFLASNEEKSIELGHIVCVLPPRFIHFYGYLQRGVGRMEVRLHSVEIYGKE